MKEQEQQKAVRYTLAYLNQEIMRIEDFLMSNRNGGDNKQRIDSVMEAVLSELKADLEVFEGLTKLHNI